MQDMDALRQGVGTWLQPITCGKSFAGLLLLGMHFITFAESATVSDQLILSLFRMQNT